MAKFSLQTCRNAEKWGQKYYNCNKHPTRICNYKVRRV